MHKAKLSLALLLLCALAAVAQMQFQMGPPLGETEGKIMAELKNRSKVMDTLEYLVDMIGPRLTGAPASKRAHEWAVEQFKNYGLENAHLETYTIANGWERVSASGRIIEPAAHRLIIESMAWAPSTSGKVRGPVVQVSARTVEELQAYKGKLKGAIVVTPEMRRGGSPAPAGQPQQPAAQRPAAQPPAQPSDPQQMMERFMTLARQREEFFKSEGVAAILRNGAKEYGLFSMTSAGRNFAIAALPTGMITSENYRLIERLLKRGPVEVELELANKITAGPVTAYNTVADLPGSEKPEEIVLLGAHLDSWDLGTGTIDDGTGSAVVLEVARAMKALNLKPKRTIRFALWSGEEEGLVGSKEFAKAHKDELAKYSAVLVHDTGTGKVTSIGMSGDYPAREVVDQVLAPMNRPLGLQEPSMRSMNGTDHASFVPYGVPGFWCIQDEMDEYMNHLHHSQADTFDKAKKDNLVQGAQVMAVFAYRVAELPDMLPRRATPAGRPATSE